MGQAPSGVVGGVELSEEQCSVTWLIIPIHLWSPQYLRPFSSSPHTIASWLQNSLDCEVRRVRINFLSSPRNSLEKYVKMVILSVAMGLKISEFLWLFMRFPYAIWLPACECDYTDAWEVYREPSTFIFTEGNYYSFSFQKRAFCFMFSVRTCEILRYFTALMYWIVCLSILQSKPH